MMKAEVLSWCRSLSLFSEGDRVICAVSGGADSMAMLWCLRSLQNELGICVSAAHFNHCLRAEEDAFDIQRLHTVPFLKRYVLNARHTGDTGIVYPNVYFVASDGRIVRRLKLN